MVGLQLLFFATVLSAGGRPGEGGVAATNPLGDPLRDAEQKAPFDFFAVSDLERVFEDGYNRPELQSAIEIFGIRNEYVCAQCVIKAGKDLERVTVCASPLRHAESSVLLPENSINPPYVWRIKLNFVGSIPIEQNTPKYRKADLIRPAPARFPDYLAEEKETSVEKDTYKAVFLTIKIPRDADAGTYTGSIIAKTDAGDRSLPLRLTVYPLTLPDERHLMVTEWYTTGRFQKFHGIDSSDPEQFYQMLGVYASNMAEHRQNVFRVSLDLISSKLSEDGKLKFDFSRFDKWAQIFWDTGRMNLLETGFVARFGQGGWSSREIVLRDFRVEKESTSRMITVPGKEFLPQFLPALENHLREKGWLEKTVFHIADEPSNHNVMSWREASQFVHEHAPALRRIDAIETTHCFDRLEIWVPKLDYLATWYDTYEKARQQGCELWFYTVGIFQKGSYPNKTVDVPLIESRILHWLNYRFGLKGYLHWGFNSWTDDPYNAPGEHRGDGWHVYPRDPALPIRDGRARREPKKGGLINSLRWEQMRNGIQDYEYLWMLENKIKQVRDTWHGLPARENTAKMAVPPLSTMIEPSRRPAEIASQIVKTIHQYSKNPAVLYAAKRQIIDELLDLDKSPKLIVQTNPLEHSTIANDCAVDVYGYAETETKIVINGKETPVCDDGLFMESTVLSKENTIVIEAQSKSGKKTIVRTFQVLY